MKNKSIRRYQSQEAAAKSWNAGAGNVHIPSPSLVCSGFCFLLGLLLTAYIRCTQSIRDVMWHSRMLVILSPFPEHLCHISPRSSRHGFRAPFIGGSGCVHRSRSTVIVTADVLCNNLILFRWFRAWLSVTLHGPPEPLPNVDVELKLIPDRCAIPILLRADPVLDALRYFTDRFGLSRVWSRISGNWVVISRHTRSKMLDSAIVRL